MKLFIYDHCPFCVKARMIFGLKHLPIRPVTLLNDDETTPFNLIGKNGTNPDQRQRRSDAGKPGYRALCR